MPRCADVRVKEQRIATGSIRESRPIGRSAHWPVSRSPSTRCCARPGEPLMLVTDYVQLIPSDERELRARIDDAMSRRWTRSGHRHRYCENRHRFSRSLEPLARFERAT